MKATIRAKLPHICTIIGAVIGGLIGLVVSVGSPPKSGDGAALVAVFIKGTVITIVVGLLVGLLGGIVGFIISALMPSQTTKCPQCGSNNAIAACKSLVGGKRRPNRCPDCKHEW